MNSCSRISMQYFLPLVLIANFLTEFQNKCCVSPVYSYLMSMLRRYSRSLRKNQNKFYFSLVYSYLCTLKLVCSDATPF